MDGAWPVLLLLLLLAPPSSSYPVSVRVATPSDSEPVQSHAWPISQAVPVSCSILGCSEAAGDVWRARRPVAHARGSLRWCEFILCMHSAGLPAACTRTPKIKCVWYWKFILSRRSPPACDSAETAALWYLFIATPAKHSLARKQCLASCVCVCVCVCMQPFFCARRGCRARCESALPRAGVSAAGVWGRGAPERRHRGGAICQKTRLPVLLHSTTAVQIYCGSIGRVTRPPPPAVPLFLRQVGVAALHERDSGLYGGREASRGLPLLTEGGQQRIADHVDTHREAPLLVHASERLSILRTVTCSLTARLSHSAQSSQWLLFCFIGWQFLTVRRRLTQGYKALISLPSVTSDRLCTQICKLSLLLQSSVGVKGCFMVCSVRCDSRYSRKGKKPERERERRCLGCKEACRPLQAFSWGFSDSDTSPLHVYSAGDASVASMFPYLCGEAGWFLSKPPP